MCPFSRHARFPLLRFGFLDRCENAEVLYGRGNGGSAVDFAGGVRVCLSFGRRGNRPNGTASVLTLSDVVILGAVSIKY